MTLNMDYRRWTIVSAACAGAAVLLIGYLRDDLAFARTFLLILGLALGVLLWSTRPGLGGPQLSHAAAQAAAGPDDVILYWMPGCIYCDLLKRGLGGARHDVTWVNILEDPAAADFVAVHRDGNTTVPTAVTGAGELIEANPAAIKARLKAVGANS